MIGVNPEYFLNDMYIWEAELAYEGYRRKDYSEWARTQRIAYIIACSNSTKPRTINPNDIVNLDVFDDLFDEKKDEEKEEVKETKEELMERLNKQSQERLEAIRKSMVANGEPVTL